MTPDEVALRDLIATGRAAMLSVDRSAQAVEKAAWSIDQAATLAQSSALRVSYFAGVKDGAIGAFVIAALLFSMLRWCRKA